MHHDVPLHVTLIFAFVLAGMVITLALEEKIHAKKSLIVSLFAVVSLFGADVFHLLPLGPVENTFDESITMPVYIQGIDWGVITIIVGSSLFVDIAAQSGLFTWIAIKLTKASGGDPWKILIYYGWMTVLFSAVLNNVTAMIIVGSLTGVSLKKLGRTDLLLGFLLIEGLLTNIGGLLTLISSVPNIIVGQTAGISFMRFLIVAAPYVLASTVLTLWMGKRLYSIPSLSTDAEKQTAEQLVGSFDENDGIESRGFFLFSAFMTLAFVATIATTSALPYVSDLGMGFVALGFAVLMLLRFKNSVGRFYSALDWDLIVFFIALFVVINVMEHAHVLALIGDGLKHLIDLGPKLGVGSTLVSAAAFSSVTDNIPLAAMLAKILKAMATASDSTLWWSVIFGANLGGNLTPIGSASTVVAVTIMHKEKVPMGFGAFVVAALPFALAQIALAVVYVLFVLPLF